MLYLNFIFFMTLLITGITDWRSYRIPNSGVLILAALSLVFIFLNNSWAKSFISGFVVLILLASLYGLGFLFRKKAIMGIGDIKLCAVLGLTLSLYTFPLFFILTGIFGLLTNLYFRVKKKTPVSPLGPGICLSYFIIYYFFQ